MDHKKKPWINAISVWQSPDIIKFCPTYGQLTGYDEIHIIKRRLTLEDNID